MKNSLRISILTRDNYTCQYCGRRAPNVALHVEHIRSRFDGGADHPSNLVAACTDCNYGKGKRSLVIEEFERQPVVPLPPDYLSWLMGAVSDAHDRVTLGTLRGLKHDRLSDVVIATAESEEWVYDCFGPDGEEITA